LEVRGCELQKWHRIRRRPAWPGPVSTGLSQVGTRPDRGAIYGPEWASQLYMPLQTSLPHSSAAAAAAAARHEVENFHVSTQEIQDMF